MTNNTKSDRTAIPTGKAKRSMKNYLLQPSIQMKIGLYSIILSILFAVTLGAILYINFAELVDSIVLMTDLESEVRDLFIEYWNNTKLWIYLTFVVYLVLTIAVSILYIHRLVGPTIAFRRHIRNLSNGQYSARTHLRKGDAFTEVAEELNYLSNILERSKSEKTNAQPLEKAQ